MIKIIKSIFTAATVMIAGMYGGQKNKAVRRFGIPTFAVALNWKRGWPLLLLIPVLVCGYGEDSVFMQLLHNEILVRVAYGLALSMPFYFYGLLRGCIASFLLVIAFQIQAGTLGYVSWFGDFLVEDMVRYGILGSLIAFNLFFYKE